MKLLQELIMLVAVAIFGYFIYQAYKAWLALQQAKQSIAPVVSNPWGALGDGLNSLLGEPPVNTTLPFAAASTALANDGVDASAFYDTTPSVFNQGITPVTATWGD